MKILLITPPLTQLNTPYPATAQLLGFLQTQQIEGDQMDLSIELVQAIFTQSSLKEIIEIGIAQGALIDETRYSFWLSTIEPVIRFLSGKDNTLAHVFSKLSYWFDSPRLPEDEEDLDWDFGILGFHDRAKYFCTLFLKDICDFIKNYVDAYFELIRYAEQLSVYLPSFTPLEKDLQESPTFIERKMLELFRNKILATQPEWVGFSVPFPGNLFSALRCAQLLKIEFPSIHIVMGGGYVNTELRQLSDRRIFNYIDYLTFDDGELPLLRLLNNGPMIRTLHCSDTGEIVREQMDSKENIPFSEIGAPNYSGICFSSYIDTIDVLNPMHALWSNGRWNKMMLSHGCYWGKCTFCDVNLDYIGRYEECNISLIVDRMEEIMQKTGQSGFHFVDEAASPSVLRKLAEEIIQRELVVSYWTNIRFEKSFSYELCQLLAVSGCIAVAGGLEVASPRILQMINKGITISTAATAMKCLSKSGILVHAYLMYGFPTETEQETIDSLEVVRQLFEKGWLNSAFWHRYAMTVHSPSGQNPNDFQAKLITKKPHPFANNEIYFKTSNPIDLDSYEKGLQLATYNYMRGSGYDLPLSKWFKIKVPHPKKISLNE